MTKDIDTLALRMWRNRKNGVIKRRHRNEHTLTIDQRALAERMQDAYAIPTWEQAVKYLDWYSQLAKGWITTEVFEQETGLKLKPESQGE